MESKDIILRWVTIVGLLNNKKYKCELLCIFYGWGGGRCMQESNLRPQG